MNTKNQAIILVGLLVTTLVSTVPAQAQAPTPEAVTKEMAIERLLETQNKNGSWGYAERDRVLTTATVLQALHAFGVKTPQVRRAEAWLHGASPRVTNDVAQTLLALHASDLSFDTELLETELELRNVWPATGSVFQHDSVFPTDPALFPQIQLTEYKGWGLLPGQAPSVLDSASAIEGLDAAGTWFDSPVNVDVPATWGPEHLEFANLRYALAFGGSLFALQPLWLAGEPSWTQPLDAPTNGDVLATARVLSAQTALYPPVKNNDAHWWLQTQKQGNGSFEGSYAVTAVVYVALKRSAALSVPSDNPSVRASALQYLVDNRNSWMTNPYESGLALLAIHESGLATDTDGDGQVDAVDTDDDNDGVLDVNDAFALDADESSDMDGDGRGDIGDLDKDGDGFCDEACPQCVQACPMGPCQYPLCSAICPPLEAEHSCMFSSDPSGIPLGGGPSSPSVRTGVGDLFPDDPNAHYDSDGDGIADAYDTDIDGDGVDNTEDAFPENPGEVADNDRDGVGDNEDDDDDNDGIVDASDNCPLNGDPDQYDGDADGVGDVCKLRIGEVVIASRNSVAPFDVKVERLDPETDERTVLLEEPRITDPGDIVLAGRTMIYIADGDAVRKLDLTTGRFTTVAEGSLLEEGFHMTLDPTGNLIASVQSTNSIIQIDHITGEQFAVCPEVSFEGPLGIDIAYQPSSSGQIKKRFVVAQSSGVLLELLPGNCATAEYGPSDSVNEWTFERNNAVSSAYVRVGQGFGVQQPALVVENRTPRVWYLGSGVTSVDVQFDVSADVFLAAPPRQEVLRYSTWNPVTEKPSYDFSPYVPQALAVAMTACSDGLDNDRDYRTDWGTGGNVSDFGCSHRTDDSERDETGVHVCDDGIDNDGDGLSDAPDDPGCAHGNSTLENPKCNDGIDNDGDGHVDLDDPHCNNNPARNSEKAGGCGSSISPLGAFSTPVMVLLMLLGLGTARQRVWNEVRSP